MSSPFDQPQLQHQSAAGGWRSTATKIVAGLAGAIILIASIAFSLIVFAFAAIVILFVVLYFWWKTRAVRQQMREAMQSPVQPARPDDHRGDVIEGEVIRSGSTDRASASRPHVKID